MKTNIIRINTDKLSEEIEKFETITNQNAYLFMNTATMDCMSTMFKESYPFVKGLNNSNCRSYIIAKFHDRNAYINDDLQFGEIEIR